MHHSRRVRVALWALATVTGAAACASDRAEGTAPGALGADAASGAEGRDPAGGMGGGGSPGGFSGDTSAGGTSGAGAGGTSGAGAGGTSGAGAGGASGAGGSAGVTGGSAGAASDGGATRDGSSSGKAGDAGSDGAATWQAIPFEIVGAFQSHALSLPTSATYVTSAAQFLALLGTAPPSAVDFAIEHVVVVSTGDAPFPSTSVMLQSLAWDPLTAQLVASADVSEPGPSCNTLVLEAPAVVIAKVSPLSALPASVEPKLMTTTVDCTAAGAPSSAACDQTTLCDDATLCGGLTRSTSGLCYPVSFYGTFSSTTAEAIPDAGVLTRDISVSGLSTVDVDVVIRLAIDHPAPEELHITLTNPSSNEVLVFDGEGLPGGTFELERVPVGFSGDESVNGTWVLTIEDTQAGNAGQLLSVELELVSRLD